MNEKTDTEKLIIICDALSEEIYGGERAWEKMDFEKFVKACRDRIINKIWKTADQAVQTGDDTVWLK